MFCENCGNQIEQNENFCGKCGTRTKIKTSYSDYEVFNYNEKTAKDNDCHITYNQIIVRAILLSIPIILAAIICPFVFEEAMIGIIAAFVICFVMLGVIIIYAINMGKQFRASLWALVLDKQRNIYYVVQNTMDTIVGWDTPSRIGAAIAQSEEAKRLANIAQSDSTMIEAVKKYQNGELKRTTFQKWFVTPKFIVVELKNPKMISNSQKCFKIEYESESGKRKTIQIYNVYAGFGGV